MSSETSKCLGVAEQIIRVLDDPSIFERYMRIKEKIMTPTAVSPTKDPAARQLITENRSLVLRIEELKADFLKQKHLESWIVTQMQLLLASLLPNCGNATYDSFTEASSGLLATIEAKFASHQFLRDRLVEENRSLQESLLGLKESALSQIENSRTQRVDADANWAKTRTSVSARIRELQEAVSQGEKKLAKLQQKTISLKATVSNLPLPEAAQERESEIEEKLNAAHERRNLLRHERDMLQFSVRQFENEFAELERIQKFRVDGGQGTVTPDELRAEVERLETQNTRLRRALQDLQE
jgi:hypothetical protein